MKFGEVTGKEMRKDGEYSTTDKFIRNTAKFNSNNLSCA